MHLAGGIIGLIGGSLAGLVALQGTGAAAGAEVSRLAGALVWLSVAFSGLCVFFAAFALVSGQRAAGLLLMVSAALAAFYGDPLVAAFATVAFAAGVGVALGRTNRTGRRASRQVSQPPPRPVRLRTAPPRSVAIPPGPDPRRARLFR